MTAIVIAEGERKAILYAGTLVDRCLFEGIRDTSK